MFPIAFFQLNSFLLNDPSHFRQSWDYGLGQGPGQESQGGSTFCGVASLAVLDRLKDMETRDRVVDWCVRRQIGGFQGRANKVAGVLPVHATHTHPTSVALSLAVSASS